MQFRGSSGGSLCCLLLRPSFWREMRSAARSEKKCIEGKNVKDWMAYETDLLFSLKYAFFQERRKLRLRMYEEL